MYVCMHIIYCSAKENAPSFIECCTVLFKILIITAQRSRVVF